MLQCLNQAICKLIGEGKFVDSQKQHRKFVCQHDS